MNYLKAALIENFETHKHTRIDFSAGINLLTGASEAGKSSILRAIRWACYNEPCGDDFIRYDSEYLDEQSNERKKKKRFICSVTIWLSNGYVVKRAKARGAVLNQYVLTSPEGEVTEFNDFRNEVPEEVRSALGFSYITQNKDKVEINYIPQLGNPLVLTYEGRELSRLLNQLNDAEIFEEVHTELNRFAQPRGEYYTESKVINAKIAEYESELDGLTDHSDLIAVVDNELLPLCEEAERLEAAINMGNELFTQARSIKEQDIRIRKEVEDIDALLEYGGNIDKAATISSRIKSAELILQTNQNITERYDNLKRELDKCKQYSEVDFAVADAILIRIKAAQEVLDERTRIGNNLKEMAQRLDVADAEIVEAIEAKDAGVVEILATLTEQNTCPVCKQELDEPSLEHALAHFA